MTEQQRRARGHAEQAERLLACLDVQPIPSAEDNTLGGQVERWRQAQAVGLATAHATLAVYYQGLGYTEPSEESVPKGPKHA